MRNALLIMLAVWLLVVGAEGATWRLAQREGGDPDEYELSRALEWVETDYRYLEPGFASCGQSRMECQRYPEHRELNRDASNFPKEKHQGLVINFSGSLFFLEK